MQQFIFIFMLLSFSLVEIARPNVVAYMMQGNLQSLQEFVHYSVRPRAIPYFSRSKFQWQFIFTSLLLAVFLIAHPNVVGYMMQGGLQSLQEAVHYAVPLIAIPFFGDQNFNARKILHSEIGLTLDVDTMNNETIVRVIKELVENEKYDIGFFCLNQLQRSTFALSLLFQISAKHKKNVRHSKGRNGKTNRSSGVEHRARSEISRLRAPQVSRKRYRILRVLSAVCHSIFGIRHWTDDRLAVIASRPINHQRIVKTILGHFVYRKN